MTLSIRILTVGGALCALSVGTTALARPQTDEPQKTEAMPATPSTPQATPSTPQATPTQATPPITDTTPEPGQEKLPPCPLPPAPPAAEAPPPEPQPSMTVSPPPALLPMAHAKRRHNIVFAPQEISLITGAGVGNYFGKASPSVDTGATWDARATFGAHSIIALEAGYVGGVNQIEVAGQAGHLNTNGIDGNFRLQLPYRWQPYLFSGVGWNHVTVDNTAANPNVNAIVRNTDDQVALPAGGGFAAYLGKKRHATLDLRGTYRYIPNNGITIMQTDSLHQWTAQARIGYTF